MLNSNLIQMYDFFFFWFLVFSRLAEDQRSAEHSLGNAALAKGDLPCHL
jgi:hypothetical protein